MMSNGGSLPTQLVERLGYWDKKMPRAINGMKECTGCRETKPISAYQKQSSVKDGLRSRCRACRSTDTRTPRIVDGRKVCFKCKENKPVSEYYVTSTTGWIDSACKDCVKEVHRQRLRETEEWKQRELERLERERLFANGRKMCPKCNKTKALEDFNRSTTRRNSYAVYCRECKMDYYENDKERILAVNKEYRDENREKINEAAAKSYYEKKRPAVYQILCKTNGKVYIGQSSGYVSRWTQHRSKLKRGIHDNACLREDYNTYGLEAFEFSVIQEYPPDTPSRVLLEQEGIEILRYARMDKELYNMQIPPDNGDIFEDIELADGEFNAIIAACKQTNKTPSELLKEKIKEIISEKSSIIKHRE